MVPEADDREVVTYDGLPASAGGAHALRVRGPAEARDRVDGFLRECTEPTGDARWAFQVMAGGDPAATDELAATAGRVLGGPRRTARTHREWALREGDVPEMLGLLTQVGRATTPYGGPLATVTQSLALRLLDPGSQTPWAGLEPAAFAGYAVDGYGRTLGVSGLRATYGTSGSSLSVWLNLPTDERLPVAARHVQDHLPMRLSAQHWRLWRPTTTGDGFRSSKITSPLAAT